MTLYQIIYDWYESLLDGSNLSALTFEIGGQNMSMDSWLCHSATIFTLVMFCVLLFCITKYLFKAGSDLIKW